ncbi:MAG: hypothetical protein JWM11_849 [Planctomycetaceae bacterium]|nr:hypothetical protein [Planctomycetaceae bacterium]
MSQRIQLRRAITHEALAYLDGSRRPSQRLILFEWPRNLATQDREQDQLPDSSIGEAKSCQPAADFHFPFERPLS